jgi:hypothetical protein
VKINPVTYGFTPFFLNSGGRKGAIIMYEVLDIKQAIKVAIIFLSHLGVVSFYAIIERLQLWPSLNDTSSMLGV